MKVMIYTITVLYNHYFNSCLLFEMEKKKQCRPVPRIATSRKFKKCQGSHVSDFHFGSI